MPPKSERFLALFELLSFRRKAVRRETHSFRWEEGEFGPEGEEKGSLVRSARRAGAGARHGAEQVLRVRVLLVLASSFSPSQAGFKHNHPLPRVFRENEYLAQEALRPY